jgi:signal transduction histidine kinase
VVLSTLARPPAVDAEMSVAAAAGRLMHLRAGDGRFLALPIAEAESLHLLMLAEPTWLDRVGVVLRFCLCGLLAVGAGALGRAWASRASLPEATRGSGSFYRKLLVALLVASVVPVLGLSFFVRGYIERRAQTVLLENAARLATVVRRVVEDYAAPDPDDTTPPVMNDEVLHWLRRVIGQEINLYEGGMLTATSKRELFSSGLLTGRLPGAVQDQVVLAGHPSVVLETRLGASTIPVAYTRVHLAGPPERDAVVAVPLVLERRQLVRAVGRVREMLLLASVALIAVLAFAASVLARTVARPLHELAEATRRIAGGDYATRLVPRTRDEIAQLVAGFNTMASALAAQRADLERRRDYIEALVLHATAGVVSTDSQGRVVTLNPAAARLLARRVAPPAPGDELVRAVAAIPELHPLAELLKRPAPHNGEPEDVDVLEEGKPRRLRLVRVPLPDPDGGPPGGLVLVDDVSDLVRSNQLAAWAEMARVIAHEIKNPLTPIRLSAEHLEQLLRDRGVLPAPELEACIVTILAQVASLREIASEFSAYAKLPDLVLVPTDPAQLLRDAVAPYRGSLPPGVVLEERYAAAPAVSVDRRVLARAVVNLVENALQAMPGGGTLTIELRHAPASSEVVLAVADTGPGLDPIARARLFEPYFSTKSAGTGLGLAIVRRAVEAHRGRIEVGEGAAGGTEFRLVLPSA